MHGNKELPSSNTLHPRRTEMYINSVMKRNWCRTCLSMWHQHSTRTIPTLLMNRVCHHLQNIRSRCPCLSVVDLCGTKINPEAFARSDGEGEGGVIQGGAPLPWHTYWSWIMTIHIFCHCCWLGVFWHPSQLLDANMCCHYRCCCCRCPCVWRGKTK